MPITSGVRLHRSREFRFVQLPLTEVMTIRLVFGIIMPDCMVQNMQTSIMPDRVRVNITAVWLLILHSMDTILTK